MSDGPEQITQDEIEALLRQTQGLSPPEPADTAARAGETSSGSSSRESGVSSPRPAKLEGASNDIEFLLRQAEEALASVQSPSGPPTPPSAPRHSIGANSVVLLPRRKKPRSSCSVMSSWS